MEKEYLHLGKTLTISPMTVWRTKKVRSLFPLKNKNLHPSCKIYSGLCLCGEDYVGGTKRNISVRYDEQNKPFKIQNQLRSLNGSLTIILLGGFYVMHHQMLDQVRILKLFL